VGLHGAGDVNPCLGNVGARVHEQALAFLADQRQRPQKRGLRRVEPSPRPVDRRAGVRVHGLGRACDRLVMVAEERDGAFFDHAGDGVDDIGGIGAVADVVAEEDVTFDLVGARVIEAGRQGLPVAVDIGQQGDPHDLPSERKRVAVSTFP
jgi:hypothetical protein